MPHARTMAVSVLVAIGQLQKLFNGKIKRMSSETSSSSRSQVTTQHMTVLSVVANLTAISRQGKKPAGALTLNPESDQHHNKGKNAFAVNA